MYRTLSCVQHNTLCFRLQVIFRCCCFFFWGNLFFCLVGGWSFYYYIQLYSYVEDFPFYLSIHTHNCIIPTHIIFECVSLFWSKSSRHFRKLCMNIVPVYFELALSEHQKNSLINALQIFVLDNLCYYTILYTTLYYL